MAVFILIRVINIIHVHNTVGHFLHLCWSVPKFVTHEPMYSKVVC